MSTTAYRDPLDRMSSEAKSSILALSILVARIASLPKESRDSLYELLIDLRDVGDPEDRRELVATMEEILADEPATTRPVDLKLTPLKGKRKTWAEHVGQKIRAHREAAELTQTELATRSGLPQSHISRLERAEYSPTRLTLEKIAKALNLDLSDLDATAE